MAPSVDLRDRALTSDIHDLLANDRRLAGLRLSVAVRGGVAHLLGAVRSDDERQLVRRLVGRMRGVHAVWDVLGTPEEPPSRVIDLGCGTTKRCWRATLLEGARRHRGAQAPEHPRLPRALE
jgi:hypothetical protein